MDEEEKLIQEITAKIETKIKDAVKGSVSAQDYEKFREKIMKELKEINQNDFKDKMKEIETKNIELFAQITKQNEKIIELSENKMKDVPETLKSYVQKFQDEIVANYDKDSGRNSKKFKIPSNLIHKTVSITSDYTGTTHLITEDLGRRITEPDRPLNLRDIMAVQKSSRTYVAFPKVTNFAWVVDMKAENADLAESSFDIVEETETARRLGTFIDISKNMLNDAPYVESLIMTKLLKRLRYREDFQILWGDGAGTNLDGLMKNARSFDLTPETYIAGDIASVASYKSGTQAVVTFTAAHGLKSGYALTIAASSNYNGSYNVIVVSQTQIVIEATYVAESTAAWTGTASHPEYHNVESANEADVLSVAISTMANLWYRVNGIIINPLMSNHIKHLLKGTDNHYLLNRGIELRSGVLYINGAPTVETDAMPYNKFLIGDFKEAVALVDYLEAEMYIKDDVSYAKANKVCIIADEQVVLPIYNSLFFMQGDFTTAKAALEKP